jgi:hypothetical protein
MLAAVEAAVSGGDNLWPEFFDHMLGETRISARKGIIKNGEGLIFCRRGRRPPQRLCAGAKFLIF